MLPALRAPKVNDGRSLTLHCINSRREANGVGGCDLVLASVDDYLLSNQPILEA